MHFWRLLRIFIPLVIIAAIVAGVAVVVTSRHELQDAHGQVSDTWMPLRAALDTRFRVLATAANAVSSTPGPLHQLVVQTDRANADWQNLESSGGSLGSQVATANELEALGRRLVVSARATPRLTGNPAALAAVTAYASQKPPLSVATPFNDAVSHYERDRNRPARRLAATILGYKSVPTYDTSGSS